ncbi:MAG: uL22 family ribosomal protein [archaeon]
MVNNEEKTQTKNTQAKSSSATFKKITASGNNMPISTKHSIAICKMIKGKTTAQAIKMLEEVVAYKRAVSMEGDEIPHRKGMGSGRFPINASKEFIKLIKNLNSNALNANEDPSSLVIHAHANIPSRKRSSRKAANFKRTDVLAELNKK